MTDSNDSKQRITAVAIVIGVLLLGLIAFLLFNKVNQDKQLKAQAMELEEVMVLKSELEEDYHTAVADLDEMKGDNEELNALIESQKDELKTQKDKVDGLLSSNSRNKRNLASARDELTSLRTQTGQYLAEIQALKEQNAQLADANVNLNADKTRLTSDLSSERTNVSNLNSEKKVLVSEKEQLEVVKKDLTTKVDFASVVKVKGVSATGWTVKKSGKTVMKTYAKNVDQLKVCFTPAPNKLAGSGKERFMIRVINPVGETMAIEEMGSGVFTNTKTGQEVRYTQIKDIDYDMAESDGFFCMDWAPNVPFQKGTYEIEVYNEGYLAGSGKCVLK